MASSRTPASADSDPQELEQTCRARIAAAVPRGGAITVALSGGVDSIVLLELLRKAASDCGHLLAALHVNHGLSAHAREWEGFCRLYCRRRRIPFQAVRVQVGGNGANVEAEARRARYGAFAACGTPYLALAHHRDDQAETLLLNLLRGSGVHGLAGMPQRRRLAGANGGEVALLRPLLAVGRAEIARYAQRRRLAWIEDESNRDRRFARNFLRHTIMPLLERRFPHSAHALARSAAHLADAVVLLEALAAADCARVGEDGRLSAKALATLGEVRAANALRHYLASRGEPPPGLPRTREMLRQLTAARSDAMPAVALSRGTLRRFRGWIELVPAPAAEPDPAPRPWRGERRLGLPASGELLARPVRGEGVSAQRLAEAPVSVRLRAGGERMRLAPQGRTRTLKNLLREAGVVPWARGRLPLVYCGDRLVWAPFVGVAADYRAQSGESAWEFSWKPSGNSR